MNPKILLVDDDPSSIRLMASILGGLGSLHFATTGPEALQLARKLVPDVVLLDAGLPGMSGFQVCETLKTEPALAEVPVIFVTSHSEADFEVAGFDIGAADFIAKPVNPALVLARVKAQLRVKRMADELRRISTVDALTGVANRRWFDRALAREWRRARRGGEPLALLMADVDHFKLYNDRYGHPAGDECLRAVAHALTTASQRPADLVARYGGEEFMLLLPGTPRQGAQHMAHRVLDVVEALAIPHAASPTSQHVTVSLGLACYDEESATWVQQSPDSRFNELQAPGEIDDLVKAADAALYVAKRSGRAQGRMLDVADVDVPTRARELLPELRPGRPGRPA